MEKHLENQENNEPTSVPKFFRRLQPLLGTMIGILCFVTLFAINSMGTKSKYLAAALLAPGYLAMLFLAYLNDLGFQIPSIGYTIIIFSLSGLPYAVVGALIFSKEKAIRANGVALLVIYLVTSLTLGIFVLALGSIYN